jgi:hypothetical protein
VSSPLQPTKPFVRCFATHRLQSQLKELDTKGEALPAPAQACAGTPQSVLNNPGYAGTNYKLITVGDSCFGDFSGNFSVRSLMNDKGVADDKDEEAYGVFRLEVWLCPISQLGNTTGVSACIQPKYDPQGAPLADFQKSTPHFKTYRSTNINADTIKTDPVSRAFLTL